MKYIEEFGQEYSVSEDGRVFSNKTPISLNTRIDRYGYEIITLWYKGKHYTRKIHRLIAIAYIPNPLNHPTVNHLDGIKTNNHVSNLQWLSIKDNHLHAFETGLHSIGENRKAGRPAKLTNNDIPVIRQMIAEGYTNTQIGKRFGVSCGCIYSIRVKKSWTHI